MRRSDPRSISAGCDTVTADGAAASSSPRRLRRGAEASARTLRLRRSRVLVSETDISGVLQELALDRNMQAVVHGVVELPEADHAREFDDLWRGKVVLEPLENVIRHRCRIFRSRPHVIEAS